MTVNDSTIRKLRLSFGLVLAIFVLFMAFNVSNIAAIKDHLRAESSVIQEKMAITADLRNYTRGRFLHLQQMALNKDPFAIDEHWMAFNKYGANFAEQRMQLMQLANTAKEREILASQGRITASVIPLQLQIAELIMNEQQARAVDLLVTKAMPVQTQVFENLDILANYYSLELELAKERSISAYEEVVSVSWAVSGVTLIVLLTIASWIIKRVRIYQRNLVRLNENLEQLVRQRTKKLATAEVKQRNIIENAIDGLMTINSAGYIESINPAASKMMNLSQNETGKLLFTDYMQMPVVTEGGLVEYSAVTLHSLCGKSTELVASRGDGYTFPVIAGVSEVNDGNGNVSYICTLRDISIEKEINKMKNEFIANISHEIRTPVTSIHGTLGLLVGGVLGQLPDKAFDILKMANSNSNRLIHIINSILDLQKFEAEALKINRDAVDLVKIVEQNIEKSRHLATQKDINLLFMKTIENAEVYIDSSQMSRALDQLISNAIKFTPQHESIILGIDLYGDYFRVSITDFGQGISEDFKPVLFDKFTQENSSNTRIPGGLGLGLAFVKSIVEKHQSSLQFISEKGKGTVFYFDILTAQATEESMSKIA